jgi:hypothetical protein
LGGGLAATGVRDSSRASRSGGATKITVSLIGEGFGVPMVVSFGAGAACGRLDRSRDIGHGAERGGARLKRRLPAHDLFELLLELFLVQQLAASGAVDLGAQFRHAVFVGVLHLGLAGDQSSQDVVAKREISGGCSRPQAEQRHGADHDPENNGSKPHLLAGMNDGVTALDFWGGGALRRAPRR